MSYKNILRNKRYFIFLKYLLFLRIFLYKKNKRKMITCNKVNFNFFNFFYNFKKYKKNPLRWNNKKKYKKLKLKKFKNLIKKIKFLYFFNFNFLYSKKIKKFIFRVWRIFDKRIDKAHHLYTINTKVFKKILNINKWLRWIIHYQYYLKKLYFLLYYIYDKNKNFLNKKFLFLLLRRKFKNFNKI